MPTARVLFVCLGNICRSPTAEGVFRKLVTDRSPVMEIEIDSAGTHSYHAGDPPDDRAQAAAMQRDVDLSSIRARAVTDRDFERFDYVLAMDSNNYRYLKERCPPRFDDRVRHFLEFASDDVGMDVPDPYYGGANGFERVLDLVEDAALGLLEEITRRR